MCEECDKLLKERNELKDKLGMVENNARIAQKVAKEEHDTCKRLRYEVEKLTEELDRYKRIVDILIECHG